MKISSILCPVDFSRTSLAALEKATELARQHQAALHLIYVYEPIFTDADTLSAPTPPIPADLDLLEERLMKTGPDRESGIECSRELIFGFPSGAIVGYANTQSVDLIVIGTHGRTGANRLLMGSVAESVLRSASCPVLTIHRNADGSIQASDPPSAAE